MAGGYGKEELKNRYAKELNDAYEELLKEEENKLHDLTATWEEVRREMLMAIAKYDVVTTGGVSRDLNTLNVEIITNTEHFRSLDCDQEFQKKKKDIVSNIEALQRLIQ